MYNGCTRDVQRMYKGYPRDLQARNTGATPEQRRSNTLAPRCPEALPTVHRYDDFREQAGYGLGPASEGWFASTLSPAITSGKWLARGGGRWLHGRVWNEEIGRAHV